MLVLLDEWFRMSVSLIRCTVTKSLQGKLKGEASSTVRWECRLAVA